MSRSGDASCACTKVSRSRPENCTYAPAPRPAKVLANARRETVSFLVSLTRHPAQGERIARQQGDQQLGDIAILAGEGLYRTRDRAAIEVALDAACAVAKHLRGQAVVDVG